MKDPRTGSVSNVDREAFKAAKLAKKRILESKQKHEKLEKRVEELERIINQFAKREANE